MNWISDSDFVIGNKIYHCTNPEWIKILFNIMDKENDNDTPQDQEASQPAQASRLQE
jgi:hypothetical protein